jgi:hypothetical protein
VGAARETDAGRKEKVDYTFGGVSDGRRESMMATSGTALKARFGIE